MKYLLLVTTSLFLIGTSVSQNIFGIVHFENRDNTAGTTMVEIQKTNSSNPPPVSCKTEAAVDTAGVEYLQDSIVAYKYNGWPMFGCNPFLDKAWAQIYPNWNTFNVEKILIKFAAITGTGNIKINLYDVAAGLPAAVLSTYTLNITTIDTASNNFTVATLLTPVNVTSHFAVGVDASGLYTTGSISGVIQIRSTLQDEPHQSSNARCYVKLSSTGYTWETVATAWNVNPATGVTNSNLLIFPVVSGSYNTAITETQEINGIKLTQSYPNPSTDFTKIEYQIPETSDVKIDLIDMTGKVVMHLNEGIKTAGKHEVSLKVTGIAAGSYFYSLSAGDRRLTKELIIQ
jgi:hypothetical protein